VWRAESDALPNRTEPKSCPKGQFRSGGSLEQPTEEYVVVHCAFDMRRLALGRLSGAIPHPRTSNVRGTLLARHCVPYAGIAAATNASSHLHS
jgi:hypothetical protein